MKANDLVFVQPERTDGAPSTRTILVRLTRVNGNELTGVIEKTRHLSPATITFNSSAVVLNVGEDPFPGMVLGHDLRRLYRRTREIEYLGDVHFFTRTSKEQLTSLRKGAKEFASYLKKAGLEFLLDNGTSLEVVSKDYAGKWAGLYKHSRDPDVTPHSIMITLDKSRVESSSINTYSYVLAHEFGHALHFQYLKKDARADAAWIRAYSDTVRPVQVDKATVKAFLDTLLSAGSVQGAKGDMSEEDIPLFRRVLREVASSSKLSVREIDRLLEAEDTKDELNRQAIREAWPRSGVMHHELHPSVTNYALKHYQELFAETFAFFILGKDIPRNLRSLMEKSLDRARALAS